MNTQLNTQVLVVGAGPVGMLTAVLLAESGISTMIIDGGDRPVTHSYACALHPRSLKLLARLGLLDDVLESARRIDKVALYSGRGREAEVNLRLLATEFPYTLILPQSALETLLAARLARLGCPVRWHHRLSNLFPRTDAVRAEVDEVGGSASGYSVPHWEWMVRKTFNVSASFVIGADGQRSLVRRLMRIPFDPLAQPEYYVVYECKLERALPDEVCVVLQNHTQSVLWPQTDGRCRWSFQLPDVRDRQDTAEKDRNPTWGEEHARELQTADRLQQRLAERAPWFSQGVSGIEWAVDIQFQHRLARPFGQGRVWLVGDAAHQSSPAGIQSMNAGLVEAEDLAQRVGQVLRRETDESVLTQYDRRHQEHWQQLLGKPAPAPLTGASGWVKEHASELVTALPATGADLGALLDQLHLRWPVVTGL